MLCSDDYCCDNVCITDVRVVLWTWGTPYKVRLGWTLWLNTIRQWCSPALETSCSLYMYVSCSEPSGKWHNKPPSLSVCLSLSFSLSLFSSSLFLNLSFTLSYSLSHSLTHYPWSFPLSHSHTSFTRSLSHTHTHTHLHRNHGRPILLTLLHLLPVVTNLLTQNLLMRPYPLQPQPRHHLKVLPQQLPKLRMLMVLLGNEVCSIERLTSIIRCLWAIV